MPLILCNHWDIDVDVISGFEMEELRTFDHQVSHLNTDSKRAQRTTKTFIRHRRHDWTIISHVVSELQRKPSHSGEVVNAKSGCTADARHVLVVSETVCSAF